MPKKNNQKKQEASENLNAYLARSYRSSQPALVMEQAKTKLVPEQYSGLIAWIISQPSLRAEMFGPLLARDADELHQTSVRPAATINRELQWAASYLQVFSGSINAFVSAKQQFYRFLLTSQFSAAEDLLNKIEVEHGVSVWLVRNRILLFQMEGGIERQKAYLRTLMNSNDGVLGVLSFIAYHISVRSEPIVTIGRFIRQFNKSLAGSNIPDSLSAYLKFHILADNIMTPKQMADVLSIESSASLIDYYETTVRLATLAWAEDKNLSVAVRAVAKICTDPIDNRLFVASNEVVGENVRDATYNTPLPDAITSYESFLTGKYELSVTQALTALKNNPDRFELMLVAARAMASLADLPQLDLDLHPLYERITYRMAAVLARQSDDSEHIGELLKIALSNHGEPWSDSIFVFCNEQVSDEPTGATGATERFVISVRASFHPAFLFDINDQRLHALQSGVASKVLPQSVALQYGCRESVEVLQASSVTSESLLLLQAFSAYRSSNFEVAAKLAQELADVPYRYFVREAERLATRAFLEAGDIIASIEFATSVICKNEFTIDMLPMVVVPWRQLLIATHVDVDR